MGAKCCRFRRKPYEDSIVTLADLQARATDLKDIRVEDTLDDAGPSEQGPLIPTSSPSKSKGKLVSVSLETQEETLSFMASNIFWITGSFSEPLPNGFYSVIMDELDELVAKSLKVDVILVDHETDEKVSNLKKFIQNARALNSKPAQLIKTIVGLSPSNTKGIQLLREFKHGSSHTRAILFKVLADSVGLKVLLYWVFQGMELLQVSAHIIICVMVDLKQAPGNLIPQRHCSHISKSSHSDSAENDYCESPNSSISYRDEALQMQRKLARSLLQRKLSVSRSEPIIATESGLLVPGNFGKKKLNLTMRFRVVQRKSETSKQNRLLEEQCDDVSSPFS